MQMDNVDVVIPNFQGEGLLDACLDAVAAQTLQPARVLVVDDGSTDGSQAVVARHPGVEWLPLGENRGFPAAVNAGIAASTAPLVALLNTDALPEPGWLEALVRALDDPSDLARPPRACSSPTAPSTPSATRSTCAVAAATTAGCTSRTGRSSTSRASSSARARARRSTVARCSPTSASSTRPSRSRGRTSTSTCAPLLAGHRCLYVPDAVVQHAQGSSSGASRLALERRNKAWLALRGLPVPLLVPFLALVPLREAYEARAAARGRRAAGSSVSSPFAREAPRAARWRRTVTRRVPVRELLPLLLAESQPYVAAAASSSRQNARKASASLEGSREAGRTST